jgi:NADPH:quinone reductase-like Zn-dependent oxidoreductase
MSRQVMFYQTGSPEVLSPVDIEVRHPAAEEVRIKVSAIGLNRAEAMFRSGQYVSEPRLPASLGYEAAGVIEAIGSDVNGLAIGDRVGVIPAFTMNDYPMYGELVLAPAFAVVKLPDSITFETSAASWMQYGTAYGALIRLAGVNSSDYVVVPAASSSVGLAAIQIAKSVGAKVIALTTSTKKLAILKAIGADLVILAGRNELTKDILEITKGEGVRVIFDPVGGSDFPRLLAAARDSAVVIIYGALSSDLTPLPVIDMIGKHITVYGYEVLEMTRDSLLLPEMKKFILDGLAAGTLDPIIAKKFPFEQIVAAHRYLESGEQIGKIIVTVP